MTVVANLNGLGVQDTLGACLGREVVRSFWDAWSSCGFGQAQIARQVGITNAQAAQLVSSREGFSEWLALADGKAESKACALT